MRSPLVIDQEFIDDQRATMLQGLIGLLDKHALSWQIPVVQDHSHNKHISAGQIIDEEVAGNEAQPLRHAVRRDIAREDRLHRGQLEAAAGQMGMSPRQLDRNSALGSPNIENSANILPRKHFGHGSCNRQRLCAHGTEEGF
jgi:hypothetical protein